ncbi:flavodoxin domain-containing protein [Embleya sp. NPDC050154]|uniref:flavodoxin domain-containing protein n=1 Tax=Embleya sp. NPDC050154 TaxID=3363988 RepID=UPI0037AEAEC7
MDILVAYATCHGSTRSVAERIAARFVEAGHRVDLRPAADAPQNLRYDVVVVGSAIHNGDWLEDAAEFLHRYAAELARRRVWLFNVSLASSLHGRRGRWLAAHVREPPAVARDHVVVDPQDVHSFAGVLKHEHVSALSRPLLWACGGRFGDFRDWAAIDDWAVGIAAELVRPVSR